MHIHTPYSTPATRGEPGNCMNVLIGRRLLTTDEVAKLLGVSAQFVKLQRPSGDGIPYVRLGRLVRYDLAAVEAFLAANTVASKAEHAA